MRRKKESSGFSNISSTVYRITGKYLENAVFLSDFCTTIEKDCKKNAIPIKKAPEIWAMGIENFILWEEIKIRRGNE